MNDSYANGYRSDAERALLAARRDTNTSPTPAQIESGNYAKGRLRLHGLEVCLESPKDSVRRSKPGVTPAWERRMVHDYGYISRAGGGAAPVSKDGDAVDVFIGPNLDSELVVVVDQPGRDNVFDEHKACLAFPSVDAAVAGYLAHYPKGWKLGPVTPMTIGQFKRWLAEGNTKKPVREKMRVSFLKALFPLRPLSPLMVLVKSNVKRPGLRGGRFYRTESGEIKYGTPPAGAKPFAGHTVLQQAARKVPRGSGIVAGTRINGPEDTAAMFRGMVDLDRERFWMVHMDGAAKPTAVEMVSQGSLTASIVHPREVFKNAMQLGTRAVAFVHNHPSGIPTPSREDQEITARLVEVGARLGIPVRHHVVVGSKGWAEVSLVSTVEWRPHAHTDGKPRTLPGVEGRLVEQPPPATWDGVMETQLRRSLDVAALGRRLLDPGDRIAVALILDNKHRVIGAFPFAAERFTDRVASDVMRIAIGGGAASLIIAASSDGDQWQHELQAAHRAIAEAADIAGIRHLDTVSIGRTSHLSMVDDHTVIGAS